MLLPLILLNLNAVSRNLADSGGPYEMLHAVAFRQGHLCLKDW